MLVRFCFVCSHVSNSSIFGLRLVRWLLPLKCFLHYLHGSYWTRCSTILLLSHFLFLFVKNFSTISVRCQLSFRVRGKFWSQKVVIDQPIELFYLSRFCYFCFLLVQRPVHYGQIPLGLSFNKCSFWSFLRPASSSNSFMEYLSSIGSRISEAKWNGPNPISSCCCRTAPRPALLASQTMRIFPLFLKCPTSSTFWTCLFISINALSWFSPQHQCLYSFRNDLSFQPNWWYGMNLFIWLNAPYMIAVLSNVLILVCRLSHVSWNLLD